MATSSDGYAVRRLVLPVAIAAVFWVLGAVMWRASGYVLAFANFAYIGTAVGLGLGLYAALPRAKKPIGRKVTLFMMGFYMLGVLGVVGGEDLQIEGVFYSLLTGLAGAALMHYLVAKVFGPLLFGRLWCGWACWTLMVLDLLPFQRSPGRLPGRWGHLRYVHFAASLVLVLLLWYAFGYRYGGSRTALYWLIGGNVLYYAVGVGLAVALRDNRAFCKYVCPITLILKATTRFSLLKVKGDASRCDNCGACSRACPMDIRVNEYVTRGRRVLSTECTLCQTCVTVCPRRALSLGVGLDVGGRELLRERRQMG